MPNTLDATGLTIQTLPEVVDEIENGDGNLPGLNQTYGVDINLNPNSPDAQMVNIFAQGKIDVLELLQQIYDSFDPDQAIGVQLNARCGINGVIRQAGTYTQQIVTVTVNQALTLVGLDTAPNNPFTVADSSGNQFNLVTGISLVSAGAYDLLFQAVKIGALATASNTITNIITVQLGVIGVNNANPAISIGRNEETDSALRIRRANSVSLPSKGYYEGLKGALLDVAGVTNAVVLENDTSTTDSNGIPGHSIWCIVLGGSDTDIAAAINVKRNAGCGMKGSVSEVVIEPDGTNFTIQFDRPTSENLWISFTVAAITGSVDPLYIRVQLLAQLSYLIGQSADTTTIVSLIKAISPNATVSAEGISPDNVTYSTLLAPTGVNYLFSIASTRIIINGVPGT